MSRYAGTKRRGSGWSYYIYVDGKKKWVSGFASQRDAWLAKGEAEIRKKNGLFIDRSRVTVRRLVQESWLPSLTGRLKPSSISQYAEKIHYAVNAFGDRPVQDIRPSDVEKLRNDLLSRGLSPRTVSLALVTLSLAFKHARDVDELLLDNPCDRIKKPRRVSSSTEVMSTDEIASMEELSRGTQWEVLIRLAFYTGARRGELLALRWSDVDFEAGTIRFERNAVEIDGRRVEHSTKSGKSRVVSIDDETVAILRRCKAQQNSMRLSYGEHWHETDLVIANSDGSAPLPKSATQAWGRLRRKAGLQSFRLHDARHAHATHLLAAGVPLHVVAARLGHRDSMVTSVIYSHVLESQAIGAAEEFARVMAKRA